MGLHRRRGHGPQLSPETVLLEVSLALPALVLTLADLSGSPVLETRVGVSACLVRRPTSFDLRLAVHAIAVLDRATPDTQFASILSPRHPSTPDAPWLTLSVERSPVGAACDWRVRSRVGQLAVVLSAPFLARAAEVALSPRLFALRRGTRLGLSVAGARTALRLRRALAAHARVDVRVDAAGPSVVVPCVRRAMRVCVSRMGAHSTYANRYASRDRPSLRADMDFPYGPPLDTRQRLCARDRVQV